MVCVLKYLISVALNCVLSFLRLVILSDELFKVLMLAQNALFWNMKGWDLVYEDGVFFFVLTLCTGGFIQSFSWFQNI